MKLLALGDIHLKGGFETDEAQALGRVQALVANHRINVVIVAGDIFEAKSTPEQRLVFKSFLEALKAHNCGVYILRGNHDEIGDLKIYEDHGNNIWVSEEPEVLHHFGPYGNLQILTLPHFNAGALALTLANQDAVATTGTDLFTQILDDYYQRIKTHEGPSIVAFHAVVSGARLDNDMIPRANGIHLPLDELAALPCPVVGGHYHQHQECGFEGSGVWYTGSLTRQTFGEAHHDKGVLVFEWVVGEWKDGAAAPGHWSRPEFISIEPRPMHLIDAQWDPKTQWCFAFHDDDEFSGARIRFRYTVNQQDLPTVDLTPIKEFFAEAYELKIEQVVKISTAVRCDAITQAESIEDCLKVWLAAKGINPEGADEVVETYRRIMDEPAPEVKASEQLSLV